MILSEKKYKENDNGYFESGGMFRRINQEAVMMLGGGHAILLQLAHPFIAAGVDDYSNFQSEILQRLYRTVLFMHQLVFKSRQDADLALKHFHRMHHRIRGQLQHRSGSFSPNTPYSGQDPNAKYWVLATYLDTGLKVYEKFIRPLSQDERSSYYTESLTMAKLLEIPEQIVPPTYQDYRDYMHGMINGDTLAVTKTAYALSRAVLYPADVGFLPGLSARLLRFVTAGLLDDRFRRAYRLVWDRKQDYLLDSFSTGIRLFRPVAPDWMWQSPLHKGKLTRMLLWHSGFKAEHNVNHTHPLH